MEDRPDEHGSAPSTPLPPADRPWQHPSEAGMARRDHTDRRRGRIVAVALVGVGLGLLGVGVAMGGFGGNGPQNAAANGAIVPTVVTIAVTANGRTNMATGVAVDDDGNVMIRASLLRGAGTLRAACVGEDPAPARVIARDGVDDVAIIRAQGSRCRRVRTTGGGVRVDQRVVAVRSDDQGAALVWSNGTVRTVEEDRVRNDGTVDHRVFRAVVERPDRHDSGVVFTTDGRLAGVVIDAPSDSGGLPVRSAEVLLRTARALIAGRPIVHPWIGITADDVDPTKARTAAAATGCVVTAVTIDGPADQSGIRPGDIILGVDGAPVTSLADVARVVHRHRPGDRLRLAVLREGDMRLELDVTVAQQPLR